MALYLLVRREPFSAMLYGWAYRIWHRRGQDLYQDGENEMFSGGSIIVWGCFSHDHKLDLKLIRQTLTGQHYIIILEPIVYSHFRAIKQHTQYFMMTMPVHIGHVSLQILLHRKGLRIFSGQARVPI